MVKVVSPNGTVIQDNIITMFTNSGRYYTTKGYSTRGKWYYEFSHLSGTEMYFCGFISKSGSELVTFYPYKTSSYQTTIYFAGVTSPNWNIFDDLKISTYSYGGTYGIGLDIDNMMFYIRSSYEVRIIEMNQIDNRDGWSPLFFETAHANNNDTLSINFGENIFEYAPPFGFIPWSSPDAHLFTCNNISQNVLSLLICSIILIIS